MTPGASGKQAPLAEGAGAASQPPRPPPSTSRSRRRTPTASCSTAWATSTSCSSRTRRWRRARSALRSRSAASIRARTSPLARFWCMLGDELDPQAVDRGRDIASRSASRSRIRPRPGSAELRPSSPRRGAARDARHAHRGNAARCARAQFPHRSVSRTRQGRRRAGRRACFARHLDRRTDRLLGRGDRSCRRACAAQARRSSDRRRSWRRGAVAPPGRAGRRRADPLPARAFRLAARRACAEEPAWVAALDAFGEFTKPELAALGGLLTYVEITQVGRAPLLRPPRKESARALLIIDAATRANLEPYARTRAHAPGACSPRSTAP